MNKFGFSVLKGQHLLTQGNPGKTGIALGLRTCFKIVREKRFIM